MSNDSKLGLVLGLTLVLLIGVVFFRREPGASSAGTTPSTAPTAEVPTSP